MGRERQRERLTALSLLGLMVLLPSAQSSAFATGSESSFYMRSENTVAPEFNATAGLEEDKDSAAPSDPGDGSSEDPEESTPEPGKDTDGDSAPSPEPSAPVVEPSEEPEAPMEEVLPVFTPGPGAYELSKVSWNQMSAKQVCADVTVRGTGAPVQNWYLTMNAATVPFNHDFSRDSYQFPTWGYGFEGNFEGGKIKIVGSRMSQWNDFSTLAKGQERTLRICNWNAPKPPSTHRVTLTQLSENPGPWSWSTRYRVSAPEAQFYTSWKVRVDLSKLNAGYRGSAPLHSTPGPGDLKITHIAGDIYEIEGIGWPNMGVRSDHSIEFTLGR